MAGSTYEGADQRPDVAYSTASDGKPDSTLNIAASTPGGTPPEDPKIDKRYWLQCLDDAERAEKEWRTRGRTITQIYRNAEAAAKSKKQSTKTAFNILYANTEVMLPAVYQKPPKPIVRARFTAPSSTPPAPGRPAQTAIETAASVMEKALEIVLDDEQSDASVKGAIKDMMLPGRGECRVRWKPEIVKQPAPPDPLTGQPAVDETGQPAMIDVKVWEEVSDEYVYWEDILFDPVRAPGDTDWIAFRHLFAKKQLTDEFTGSKDFDKIVADGKVEELLKWTEESAAKDTVGGGSPMKSANNLGDHTRKAMVWEIWDRVQRQVIWLCRDSGGLVMRVDPDAYKISTFYPCPLPILAVTTTDSQIPTPFYDLYAGLAEDLDETSKRISALTKQIKVRGGYNSASPDIANLLTADDQKMLPVDGVDLLQGGLANHIWLVPIMDFIRALRELYAARNEIKQAIYEIMGISDIMRGATDASETATAQRIKGSMGMVRLSDQKQAAGNFVRDLLRLKAEIIATNFDAETLTKMTGEDVTPEVMEILRNNFARTCMIDIESDSTVAADEQEEQQSNMLMMQAIQGIMQGAGQLDRKSVV